MVGKASLLMVVLLSLAFGQWQPDQRLTNDTAWSHTSSNNAWCIAATGDTVHVVWSDDRDGNYEIYYKRSTDAGVTWGADTRLTNGAAESYYPSVAVSGVNVHVVWCDLRDGNRKPEIYYKRSTDAGAFWGADIRLADVAPNSTYPSAAVSGDTVHVVWIDDRDHNDEIYYKRSTDAGVTWGADTRLTNYVDDSRSPSVAVSGANVHVVWWDHRDGNEEIYYKRSTDAGVTWGTDTRLTNDPAESGYPSVAVSGLNVHVVWYDNRDGNNEIYYKRSTDAGVTWGADARLTNDTAVSYSPSVAVSGVVVHVTWFDHRDGDFEIYYKRSTDAGVTWGADTRLTTDTVGSWSTSVALSGTVVHVVWMDGRDGNWEIYYKRDPTGGLRFDVGVTRILAPFGTIDSGLSVTPACSVYNFGDAAASYPVRMRVGSFYNSFDSVSGHTPGTWLYVTFPACSAWTRGKQTVRCSTEHALDCYHPNDKKTDSVVVNVHDVGATRIISPPGLVDSGSSLTPACSVANFGTVTESCRVRMKIGLGYDTSVAVTGQAPGTRAYVTFPAWVVTAPRGVCAVSCSTELASDVSPANDRASDSVRVKVRDFAADSILSPDTVVYWGTTFFPMVRFRNTGTDSMVVQVGLRIPGTGYIDERQWLTGPGQTYELSFNSAMLDTGRFYTAIAYTVFRDANPGNDTCRKTFKVKGGWELKDNLPGGDKHKGIKDGAALAYAVVAKGPRGIPSNPRSRFAEAPASTLETSGFVYALKGNNTCEFYRYDIAADQWQADESMPRTGRSGRPRAVRKGSTLAQAGGQVYAVKGHGTYEFWRYDPGGTPGTRWTQMPDVPTGSRRVREGAGSAACTGGGQAYIYFLKGSGTHEFYRFNIPGNTWETMADAPIGGLGKEYKSGSALVYYPNDQQDIVGHIYALKGMYNEFYAYDLSRNAWTPEPSLPLENRGPWKTKARDGAAMTYLKGKIYVLKGGNTNEFWRYGSGSGWVQLPDLSLGSGPNVRGGGALAAADTVMYAFKGSNTTDFYIYYPETTQTLASSGRKQEVQTNSSVAIRHASLSIAPNPFSQSLNPSISYSLPVAGNVSLKLYDVTGKLVTTLAHGCTPAGNYVLPIGHWDLGIGHSRLARGIYVLKFKADGYETTRKLILE